MPGGLDCDKLRLDVLRMELIEHPDPQLIRCVTCNACRLVARRELELLEQLSLVRRHPQFGTLLPENTDELFKWFVETRTVRFEPLFVCPSCFDTDPLEPDYDEVEWRTELRMLRTTQEWIEHNAHLWEEADRERESDAGSS